RAIHAKAHRTPLHDRFGPPRGTSRPSPVHFTPGCFTHPGSWLIFDPDANGDGAVRILIVEDERIAALRIQSTFTASECFIGQPHRPAAPRPESERRGRLRTSPERGGGVLPDHRRLGEHAPGDRSLRTW